MGWKTKTIYAAICIQSLISGILFAQTTYTYVLFVANGAKVSDVSSLGFTTKSQPLFNTLILAAPNTNYFLLQVTPKDALEENSLAFFESQSKALLISQDDLVTETVRGEILTSRTTIPVNPLPKDYNRVWISSK